MEVDSTLKVSGFTFQLTYHIGATPFRWDAEARKVVPIEKIWEKLRYYSVTFITVTARLVLLITFIWTFLSGNFDLANPISIIQLVYHQIYVMTLALDINMLYKHDEIITMTNWMNEFLIRFIDKYAKPQHSKKTHISTIVLALLIAMMTLDTVMVGLVFVHLNHRLHFLCPLIPDVYIDEQYLGIKIFLQAIQFLFALEIMGSLAFPSAMCIPTVIWGADLVKEMTADDAKASTKPILRKWSSWTNVYRSLQIVFVAGNRYFKPVGPWIAIAQIVGHVALLFALIALDMTVFMIMTDMGLQIVLLIFYYCMYYKVSRNSLGFASILTGKAKYCTTKYRQKQLKSLIPKH